MNKHEPDYSRYTLIGLILTLLVIVGFSFYWFGESARLAAASESIATERVERGKEIYAAQCAACHGAEGEGGVGPALNNKKLLKNTLDEIFFSIIRSGVPNTQMPAWSVDFGGPLTDEDVKDIVAYLRSWEPTAPEIEPVTFEPDATRGALLFASTCAICHGENGKGTDRAPALNDPKRLNSLDNDWYRATIRNGRPAKGMPTWGTVLSPNQIDDIIALISAWREGSSVQPAFSIDDLLASAIFSLQEEDPESAALHINRALSIATGKGAEVLSNAAAQLVSGDYAGAIATLEILQEQWPIGEAEAGEESYQANCSVCHGKAGEGGIGPALQNNEFVQSLNNSDLVNFILEGRAGTAMAGWEGRLSTEEIANIVAFLRTWQP